MTIEGPLALDGTTPPWDHPMGTPSPELQEAAREAAQAIAGRINLRSEFEIRGDRLDIVVRRDGSVDRTITRLPDGQIRIEPPPTRREDSLEDDHWPEDIRFIEASPIELLEDEVERMARRAIRRRLRAKYPEAQESGRRFFRKFYPEDDSMVVAKTARMAIDLALGREPDEEGCRERIGELSAADRLIYKHLARETAIDMRSTQDRMPFCSPRQYNAIIRHGEVLRQVRWDSPVLAIIWWNLLEDAREELPDPGNQADIERTIRNHLRLSPAQWRTLMAITQADLIEKTDRFGIRQYKPAWSWEEREKRLDDHFTKGNEDIGAMATGVRAITADLTEREIRAACLPHLQGIVELNEHRAMRDGEDWGRWTRIVGLAIRNHDHNENGRSDFPDSDCRLSAGILEGLGKYLKWHRRSGEPWRNRNWKNLIRDAYPWIKSMLIRGTIVKCPLSREEISRLQDR